MATEDWAGLTPPGSPALRKCENLYRRADDAHVR